DPKFAAAAQVLNVRRHAFADAGNLEKPLRLIEQGRDLFWSSFESFSRAAIGANAERVVAVDLHQIGGFVKDVGDGLIVHAIPEGNCNVCELTPQTWHGRALAPK